MSDSAIPYQLTHPVYLDVAMMTSFLAYLEGGVVTQEEATQKESGTKDRAFKGQAGLSARLPWALNAQASSEGSGQRHDEISLESKYARQHTNASLFNLLYQYLSNDSSLISLKDESHLQELRPGQLVEFTAEYLGNPLEEILAYVGAVYPYFADQYKAESETASRGADKATKAQKSGNPARRSQVPQEAHNPEQILAAVARQAEMAQRDFGISVMLKMTEDITHVPVHDLLFRMESGLQAVVTASSSYYSQEINEYLRAGEFKVIGKVTRIVTNSDTINLTRRTVLGAASPAVAEGMISNMRTGDFQLDVADPLVPAPAVQVLPMAIFI